MTGEELAVCKLHYNFSNTDNEVLSENPNDCIYCKCDNPQQDTLQKVESDVIESQQHCQNCSGKGWYMGDTDTGTYDEIQCPDCNGTGKKE